MGYNLKSNFFDLAELEKTEISTISSTCGSLNLEAEGKGGWLCRFDNRN